MIPSVSPVIRPAIILVLPLLMLWLATSGCAPSEPGHSGSGAHTEEDPLNRMVSLLQEEEEASEGAYRKLAWLTDRIGPRLSGSPQAEAAVKWALKEFERDGLANAHTEKIMVPHWVRGEETAEIVAPIRRAMVATTIGMSIPTPPEGITAQLVEVDSFEEMRALGDEVHGKIVLYNRRIVADADGTGYGTASPLRYRGASEAAKQGAVAVLIRSLGTLSARLAHTGSHGYVEGVKQIPAAAISAEDADHIHRLVAAGDQVEVKLVLGCRLLPDVESANVMADLPGHSIPEEVVVIGGHLDSWDLGTGAIDDGAGVAVSMEALRILKKLDLIPRRTIRAVLFMNEENGNRGGNGYASQHADELDRHVAAIESDTGAGPPVGFSIQAGTGAEETIRELAARLERVGATMVSPGRGGGVDIAPMRVGGVPLLGLKQDMTHYFDWHHTVADTLDKVNREELIHNVVALAFMAYAIADLDEPLPRIPPQERKPPQY